MADKRTQFFLLLMMILFSPLITIFATSNSESTLQGSENAGSRLLIEEDSDVHEVHCSRERSRVAWSVIEKYLMPFVEHENYQIPTQCRLHPSNDLFRDQEEHKIHVDVNDWKCGYCKKIFRAEKYIDQHFDSRHYNLLNVKNGKCLADLCGALHCDAATIEIMESKARKSKCNPAAAAKNRHLCESLADSCFPISEGPKATRLHALFMGQFCEAHSCSSGAKKPFSKGGRKHTNVFYLAISILSLMLLPIFYLLVYFYQREMRQGTQELKRITKLGRKTKPS